MSIKSVMQQYEERIGGKFKPDSRFYLKVGINPKRFGQLLRGEKQLYLFEAQKLSAFFEISLHQLIQ